jgi:hypothetical protein
MAYTYPPSGPSISGDTVSINRFLNNPTLVARRLRTLLEQRYISDSLLSGRFTVSGGAVTYETGESIFSGENPRAIQPGMEYPLVSPSGGSASIAKTVKWGQDALVTDESIKRRQMDPVNRALLKLANQNVKYVDSVALSAINSAVTASANAAADWSTATAAQILSDVAQAKANILALNEGFMPDTVVVDDVNHAYAMAAFASAGYLPRESTADNAVLTGQFPVILGLRWLATPNLPAANKALVADSTQLGGMADEDLGGPGYVKAGGIGTEVKTIRDDENDQYRVRARRVTVPVVVEPAAARWIAAI